jgi:hypothetical protein
MIVLNNDSENAFLRFIKAYPDSIVGLEADIIRIAIATGKLKVLISMVS